MKLMQILNEEANKAIKGYKAILKVGQSLEGKKVKITAVGITNFYDPDVETSADEAECRFSQFEATVKRFDAEYDRDGNYSDKPGGLELAFKPKVEAEFYDADRDRDRSVKVGSATILISDIKEITIL